MVESSNCLKQFNKKSFEYTLCFYILYAVLKERERERERERDYYIE